MRQILQIKGHATSLHYLHSLEFIDNCCSTISTHAKRRTVRKSVFITPSICTYFS